MEPLNREAIPASIEVIDRTRKGYRVSNRTFGTAILGQKVYCERIDILTPEFGTTVIMTVEARNHELLPDGTLGDEIPNHKINFRKFTLVADNNCVVDIETDEQFVQNPNDPVSGETWVEALQKSGRKLRFQGDHMAWIMENAPVVINTMKAGFIMDADLRLNKFA
jgi:hypothetical protein